MLTIATGGHDHRLLRSLRCPFVQEGGRRGKKDDGTRERRGLTGYFVFESSVASALAELEPTDVDHRAPGPWTTA